MADGLLGGLGQTEFGQNLLGTSPEQQRATLLNVASSFMQPLRRGETRLGKVFEGISGSAQQRADQAQQGLQQRFAALSRLIPQGKTLNDLTEEGREKVKKFLQSGSLTDVVGLELDFGVSAPKMTPTETMKHAQFLFPGDEKAQRDYVREQTEKEVKGDVRQITGAALNEAMGTDFAPGALFNVKPDNTISRIGGAGTQVSVTTGPQVGTIPQGMQLVEDNGKFRLEEIPGGPVEKGRVAAEKAEEEAQEGKRIESNVVLDSIDRLDNLVAEQSVLGGTPVTGIAGAVSAFIPSTARKDAEAKAETIRTHIGFNRLQRMRDESPTGGALGQVTERELAFLQATLGSLSLDQTPEQLRETLAKIKEIYTEVLRKASAYPNAAEHGFAPTNDPIGLGI